MEKNHVALPVAPVLNLLRLVEIGTCPLKYTFLTILLRIYIKTRVKENQDGSASGFQNTCEGLRNKGALAKL
jgi:hypothetical protein